MALLHPDDYIPTRVYYSTPGSRLPTVLMSIRSRALDPDSVIVGTRLMQDTGATLVCLTNHVSVMLITQIQLEMYQYSVDEEIRQDHVIEAVEWAIVPGGPPGRIVAMKQDGRITHTDGYPILVHPISAPDSVQLEVMPATLIWTSMNQAIDTILNTEVQTTEAVSRSFTHNLGRIASTALRLATLVSYGMELIIGSTISDNSVEAHQVVLDFIEC